MMVMDDTLLKSGHGGAEYAALAFEGYSGDCDLPHPLLVLNAQDLLPLLPVIVGVEEGTRNITK